MCWKALCARDEYSYMHSGWVTIRPCMGKNVRAYLSSSVEPCGLSVGHCVDMPLLTNGVCVPSLWEMFDMPHHVHGLGLSLIARWASDVAPTHETPSLWAMCVLSLQEMPLIERPFSRLAMACDATVGTVSSISFKACGCSLKHPFGNTFEFGRCQRKITFSLEALAFWNASDTTVVSAFGF